VIHTSPIGGLSGGIVSAIIGENTLFASTAFGGQRNFTLENLGGGYYRFFFDTMDTALYVYNEGVPQTGERFFFTIALEFENRRSQQVDVIINVIDIPTEVTFDYPLNFDFTHGDRLHFTIYLNDTWHNRPVVGATIVATSDPAIYVELTGAEEPGVYFADLLAYQAGARGDVEVTITLEYHTTQTFRISAYSAPNDTDILIGQVTTIGLPISFFIILLLGLYVRVWSVPKRIRQINGQIKSLRKSKIPKPISDVKSRSELIADLYNDTYEKTKMTRTAADMPEESIPIQVPEMGELLVQLAILTNLNADELEEFKADISKMKMSEQAAFVREVIMQEAIRAARRDGKTIEETLEEIQKKAATRLGGEEAPKVIGAGEEKAVETVFLEPEEEPEEPEIPEPKKVEPKKEPIEEEPEVKPERMSAYEIEELRKDLERRGVPPYEIDTILDQARELPRELVEELVKSLEENKKE